MEDELEKELRFHTAGGRQYLQRCLLRLVINHLGARHPLNLIGDRDFPTAWTPMR